MLWMTFISLKGLFRNLTLFLHWHWNYTCQMFTNWTDFIDSHTQPLPCPGSWSDMWELLSGQCKAQRWAPVGWEHNKPLTPYREPHCAGESGQWHVSLGINVHSQERNICQCIEMPESRATGTKHWEPRLNSVKF